VSNSSFNIDINFLDANSHSVAFYCLDWDARNRAERFDIIDLATGTVLDSRTVSGFSNGQYLIWNLHGNVRVRVTLIGGDNAVVSGMFFN
jgi:alpha-L-rhamnosidase